MEHIINIYPEFFNPQTDQMTITPITGGATNLIDKITYRSASQESHAILRHFGSSSICDTKNEDLAFRWCSEKKYGPKLLAQSGREWRLEEYIDGRHLELSDLNDYSILNKLSLAITEFHHLDIPIPPSRPMLLMNLERWYSFLQHHEEILPLKMVRLEIDWLTAILNREGGPLEICHNDVHLGNFLLDSKRHLHLIDYDYVGWNYRAYDIGNLWCEMAFNNSVPEPPFFSFDSGKYPSMPVRMMFTRENPELLWEGTLCMLASHLGWALWGCVETYLSQISTFDYREYATVRWNEYLRLKSKFFS